MARENFKKIEAQLLKTINEIRALGAKEDLIQDIEKRRMELKAEWEKINLTSFKNGTEKVQEDIAMPNYVLKKIRTNGKSK